MFKSTDPLFLNAIVRLAPAMSTDGTRAAICGMAFRVADGKAQLCATDGHVLAIWRSPTDAPDHPMVVLPAELVAELKTSLSPKGRRARRALALEIDNSWRLTWDGGETKGALIDHTFPQYWIALPKPGVELEWATVSHSPACLGVAERILQNEHPVVKLAREVGHEFGFQISDDGAVLVAVMPWRKSTDIDDVSAALGGFLS